MTDESLFDPAAAAPDMPTGPTLPGPKRKRQQQAVVLPPPTTPFDLMQYAMIGGGADISVLKELMGMQREWEHDQSRKAFNSAMADLRSHNLVIHKNRRVNFKSARGTTDYRYEDLAEIARTIDPLLSQYGLYYRFRSAIAGKELTVTCIIGHRAGYTEENSLSADRDESGNKNSIQAVGSTQTYLQRQTLKAALGLAASDEEDDDGRGAADVSAKITAEEALVLKNRLVDVKGNLAGFLKIFGIEKLEDMLVSDLESAHTKIDLKAEEMGLTNERT